MDFYKINQAEAKQRIELQEHVGAMAEKLGNENPQSFGGVWIQHEPVYKIIVAFKDADTRSAIRETIEPSMRRFIQLQNVRNSVVERELIIDQIAATLSVSGVRFATIYDYENDKITVQVASESGVGRVRQLLPRELQSDIQIERASIPDATQASGAQAGDSVYPGWWYSSASGGAYRCSWAFAAKDNQGRQGILTAAHCPSTLWMYYSTPAAHWVSFAAPQFSWNALNTKYDYRFYLTSGLTTGAWLSYDNSSSKIYATAANGTSYASDSSKNVISSYGASGYFAVTGIYGYYSQVAGNVTCKTGHSTGLTCGQITNGYYTFNGAKGWIQSGKSAQFIYSTWRDSGGAVFLSPNAKGEIKAAGISVASTIYDPTPNADGTVNNSGDEKPCLSTMKNNSSFSTTLAPGVAFTDDCYMVHMPIDYIDDQQLITVNTQAAQP